MHDVLKSNTMSAKKHLVLLVNLGSPNYATFSAVRTFLKKFLSDKRVVNLPRFLWYPVLYGIILSIRAKKLVAKYKLIWLKDNSPLIHYTHLQAQQLSASLSASDYIVKSAFSYARPYIDEVLALAEQEANIHTLTVIPLYPQYSSTTTAPVFDEISRYYSRKKYIPTLRLINSFYTQPQYIAAIVNKIHQAWSAHGRGEVLVFSYHSLPVSLIKAGDSYYDECIATTNLIVAALGLKQHEYKLAFQSRFGVNKWLTPATSATILSLATSGIKKLDIVCPGFIADCLETLEEIAIMNKELFIANGGEVYNYIACLNDDKQLTELLKHLVTSPINYTNERHKL